MLKLRIGVSLAALALVTPAVAGEYYVDRCNVNHNENWMLVFDVQQNIANFWKENETRPVRYGKYYTQDGATYVNVGNDTAAPMDLKLRPNHDPSGNPVLEWTSGTVQSIMLCVNIDDTDIRPDKWVGLPKAVAEATTAYAPSTSASEPQVYTCTSVGTDGETHSQPCGSTTSNAPQPDFKTSVPGANDTGPLTVMMYPEGTNLQSVDLVLGNSTQTRVIVDTGASLLSINKTTGEALLTSGEARVLSTITSKIADGSTVEERLININRVVIGGQTLYNIKATIGPENSMMLLGMEILNRFSKFIINTGQGKLILG